MATPQRLPSITKTAYLLQLRSLHTHIWNMLADGSPVKALLRAYRTGWRSKEERLFNERQKN